MDSLSDSSLLAVALLIAFWSAVAGGMATGALRTYAQFFWDGKVTKTQYLWALVISFILALCVQLLGLQRQVTTLKNEIYTSAVNSHDLNGELLQLRSSLSEKNSEIQKINLDKDLLVSKTDNFRNQLDDKERAIRDLQNKLHDKDVRNAIKKKVAIYSHNGALIKEHCILGSKTSPEKEFSEWYGQTIGYLKTLNDESYLTRFAYTPPPLLRGRLQFEGKPVSDECNKISMLIETKLIPLKEFMSELSR